MSRPIAILRLQLPLYNTPRIDGIRRLDKALANFCRSPCSNFKQPPGSMVRCSDAVDSSVSRFAVMTYHNVCSPLRRLCGCRLEISWRRPSQTVDEDDLAKMSRQIYSFGCVHVTHVGSGEVNFTLLRMSAQSLRPVDVSWMLHHARPGRETPQRRMVGVPDRDYLNFEDPDDSVKLCSSVRMQSFSISNSSSNLDIGL